MFTQLRRRFASDPAFFQVSQAERIDAIEKLIASTRFRRGYYLLLFLSILIVTPGLLIDNASVIIGGMIISPLISPLLLLSLSIVTRSIKGMLHALFVLLLSILSTIVIAASIASYFFQIGHTIAWIPLTISPGIYMFIALCSGVTAAFAWVKKDLAPTIAGVAVAVSLLPPLCAVGVGLGLRNIVLIENVSLLFLSNIFGISFAASIVFLIMGFLQSDHFVEEEMIRHRA